MQVVDHSYQSIDFIILSYLTYTSSMRCCSNHIKFAGTKKKIQEGDVLLLISIHLTLINYYFKKSNKEH